MLGVNLIKLIMSIIVLVGIVFVEYGVATEIKFATELYQEAKENYTFSPTVALLLYILAVALMVLVGVGCLLVGLEGIEMISKIFI